MNKDGTRLITHYNANHGFHERLFLECLFVPLLNSTFLSRRMARYPTKDTKKNKNNYSLYVKAKRNNVRQQVKKANEVTFVH